MQRNRYDQAAGKWLALEAFFEQIAERLRQRDAVGVLQVMDDFAKRVGKQQGGSGEVEDVLGRSAEAAETFDGRRRFAALRTEGRLERERGCSSIPGRRLPTGARVREKRQTTQDTGKRRLRMESITARWGNAKGGASIPPIRPSPGAPRRPSPRGRATMLKSFPLPLGEGGAERRVRVEFADYLE